MCDKKGDLELIKKNIQRFPNFPKAGITFIDIFSVLRNYKAFCALKEIIIDHVKTLERVDVVAALESRGFLFGPVVALELGLPFVPIRKKGKLPGKVEQVSFTLEYGQDVFEIQSESILPNQGVLLLDDLLATGGSLAASCQLISQLKAKVVECLVIIELTDLKGRDKVPAPVHSFIQETEN
ncbi:adenine phosphoribosyltransferase-like [Macrosteles quadrilineatus]|uniref:adenine phosphoribosyltransferase-like n=1 Tax=Macrosteles quadrilineatus TaxID=74068 RepID=UPI0023E204EF|nr:adenine phosphoribosyltransferase-like [Macrosteles quadrilineatus]